MHTHTCMRVGHVIIYLKATASAADLSFISELTLAAFGVALHAFGMTFWGLWAQFDVFGST